MKFFLAAALIPLALSIAAPSRSFAGKSELVDCTVKTIVARGTVRAISYPASIGFAGASGTAISKGTYTRTCIVCGQPVTTVHYGSKPSSTPSKGSPTASAK